MRLPLTLTVLATFALAAILSLATASLTASVIEEHSREGVQAELDKTGLHWAEVHAEGLNVFLTGIAPTEAKRFLAMSTAGKVIDAARVIDNMNVEAIAAMAPPKFSIEILRNEAGISLIGLIPEESNRPKILSRLRRIAGDEKALADFMETAAYDIPEGWSPALNFALASLNDLPRSKISIAAGKVSITAMTDSPKEKIDLEDDLRSDAPRSIELVLDISAPRPVISPFTLRAVMNDGAMKFDACAADTETAKKRIQVAAEALGMAENQDCTIGLGVPSPTWGKASVVALNALGKLGGGTVTLTDADISLVAAEGTAPALFDEVVAETEKALPEIFALHAILPVTEDGEAVLPEFIATLSPEGLMQMRGRLGSELTRITVDSYAQARFGSQNIYDATRISETLPQGWTNRVMAALDALAALNNGAVNVTPDLIEVSGKTGQQDGRAKVSQLLAKRLGKTQQFSLDVAYVEALDPLANIPTPEECIAQLQKSQEAAKISFEPGSGTLDASSATIIDGIAKILEDCKSLPLEIQGHTDSQGGEAMNQSLSQTRAQAVLTALRDRRILTTAFQANGYGEATPIADNSTEAGREANRRIEFVLIQPEVENSAESTSTSEEALENKVDTVKEDATDAESGN